MKQQRKRVLNANEHTFNFPAFLIEHENINHPNYNGDYRGEFVPYDLYVFNELENHISQTIDRLNEMVGEDDGRVFKPSYESMRNGEALYFEQCFTPKISEHLDIRKLDRGSLVKLNVHFRDASDGRVFLACSYIDLLFSINTNIIAIEQKRFAFGVTPCIFMLTCKILF